MNRVKEKRMETGLGMHRRAEREKIDKKKTEVEGEGGVVKVGSVQ